MLIAACSFQPAHFSRLIAACSLQPAHCSLMIAFFLAAECLLIACFLENTKLQSTYYYLGLLLFRYHPHYQIVLSPVRMHAASGVHRSASSPASSVQRLACSVQRLGSSIQRPAPSVQRLVSSHECLLLRCSGVFS